MAEKIPEWDIFERLEKLEELKPTAEDAATLAIFSFTLGFYSVAARRSNPRQLKDVWITFLRRKNLSVQSLRVLEEWLLALCKLIEERQ